MFLGVGKLGPMAVGGGECVTAFHFQCPALELACPLSAVRQGEG